MSKILDAIDLLIAEVRRPSAEDAPPFEWAESFAGHGLVGAALTWALMQFGLPFVIAAVAAGPIYWLAKEVADMRAGGSYANGAVDTAAVWLGPFAAVMDPLAWAAALLAIAAVGAIVREVLS